MKTVSYTNMREHLAEIMEEVAQGEEICFTRKGHEPFIFKKVRTPTDQELEVAKKLKREKTIAKLKARHEKTLDLLADK
ncbi:type II toxin-antitoxin system Phd/YefM family antitoxin [Legionella israelensis]|uniref:Antitoxin n=1 Tax=Legionella israelensis TaxID=454 RepID=A0AAX1ECY2_9GAMM|nr:type II toxin-antitoxin system prevent-host-death family antitoxin [Legionella israelensis]QBR82919.1 type II toxin-antitoxin system Phd/YefM family antitoxin [Legionella israelensis]